MAKSKAQIMRYANCEKYPLQQCRKCGLVYVYPAPTEAAIDDLYSTYHAQTHQLELSQHRRNSSFSPKFSIRYSCNFQSGTLLDVGSSYGYFLDCARKRGFAAKGVELARGPAEYARAKLGLDVMTGRLEEAALSNDAFNIVTLLNVLEHLPDPYRTLSEVYRIFEPGGIVVIVVPNLNFGSPLCEPRPF